MNAPRSPFPADEDLLDVALGRADASTRARVEAACAGDAMLRARLFAISSHLGRYDALPPPPPPPPVGRVAEALAREVPRARRPRRLAFAVPAAAAAVLAIALLAGRPGGREAAERPGPSRDVAAFADGVTRTRDGIEQAGHHGAIGDRLVAVTTAEVRFAEASAVAVLEAGGALDLRGPRHAALAAGRAWFEVEPVSASSGSAPSGSGPSGSAPPAFAPSASGPGEAFRVTTRWGDVVVRGTSFEVDVRGDDLVVAVATGRVEAAGHPVGAGERLAAGTVTPSAAPAGGFARVPSLVLEAPAMAQVGEPLVLTFVFGNPRSTPLTVDGRNGLPAALWLSVTGPDGALHDLPVPPDDWLPAGTDSLTLAPGQRRAVAVRFLGPFASPGPYRGTALYRPLGLPAVRSGTVDLEVR